MYHFRIVVEDFGWLTDKNGYSAGDYVEIYTEHEYASRDEDRIRDEFRRKYGRTLPGNVKLHQIPID